MYIYQLLRVLKKGCAFVNKKFKEIIKTVSVMLIIALSFGIFQTAYAIEDFDHTGILGDNDGYEYDKFSKSWTYLCGADIEIGKDKYIVIAMKTFSEDYGPNPDETVFYAISANTKDTIKPVPVDSIDFLIGEDIYSFKTLLDNDGVSYAVLGARAQWFTEAIASTSIKDIAIRVTIKGVNYDYDASDYEDFVFFQQGCNLFNEYFVKYYKNDTTIQQYEKKTPLSINGKDVQYQYSANGKAY